MSVVFKKRKTAGRARAVQAAEEDAEETDTSVQDLVALRQLARKPTGIELSRLNKGERPKKRSAAPADADSDTEARRLVRRDNFQGETGTVDVDKHMMAYIEQQMRARGGATATPAEIRAAVANPEDELYAVAEKYKALQRSLAPELTQDEREGDVTLSAAMLTSIPEVDLGIDSRLRNIEQTEQAKRLHDEQKRTPQQDNAFARTRFMQPKNTDTQRTATDHVTVNRFRERQKR